MKKILISMLLTAVLAATLLICAQAAEPTVTFTRLDQKITLGGTEYALTDVFADTNGDGNFDAGDARYILRLSAKLEDYAQPEYFDISGDGVLDAADARIALRYTAKLDNIYTDADNNRPSGLYTGDDGKVYAFTEYGSIASGLYEADGKRYYFDPKTAEALNIITTVNGKLYYFRADGSLFTGSEAYQGQTRNFANGIEKKTGIVKENGAIRFYTDNGEMFTDGWIDLRGRTYYFYPNGKAATGLTTIDGSLYFFDGEGVAACEEFKKIDGITYYFGVDNAAASGLIWLGDDLYYFYPDTFIMAENEMIGDYFFGPDGKAIIGGEQDPEPEKYTPPAETLNSDIYKRAQQVIKKNDLKTPKDVYEYVKKRHVFTYKVENGALYSHAQIEKKGWSHFASYAFDNTAAICYYYAAECAILFDAMGIENRIVHGTGHYDSEHYWNQIKIDGEWTNCDACNGYYDVTDDYLKKACIINNRYEGIDGYTFGEYIYPVFR